MSDDQVNIEVNGIPLKARKGAMIMQVTDAADVYIPRFCYHSKLTVAANCRMCLVEVEKAPKPLPACATPVMEGMKVFTRSPKAVAAQRATMEFLLINHPLDCPICDQGGECELQDLAMGYGRDISRFSERKRVVKDENIGPLVSTDMTRCIQCTRCVRFGLEIQGFPQLGTTGRGEHMRIDTYVEQSLDHELSANIIDLCPVGALNNKPFRYHARAWEMTQSALVSPHDGFGTNIYGHVLRGRMMRVVPRENEEINETWIADRDRFGFEGMYSPERATQPMVRVDGVLQPVDWEVALTAAAEGLQKAGAAHGAASLGFLASPSATVEEMYLLAQVARGLGSNNVDHRLRQLDFRGGEREGVFPNLGLKIADVEVLEGVLVVGSNLRHEMPLLAHRIRKAAVHRGARVAFLNPRKYDFLFPVAGYSADQDLVSGLAAVVRAAAAAAGKPVPSGVREAAVNDAHRALAAVLGHGQRRAIFLGALAQRHPAYAEIRSLAAALAELVGREPGSRHRRRQCRGCVSCRRRAASRIRRHAGRRAGPIGPRHAREPAQGLRVVRRHRPGERSGGRDRGARGRRFGHRGDDAPDREAARGGTRGAAGRYLRRKRRHVRERRGTLAELDGRGERGRREPAGLESAARAGQPAEHPRRRLRELGGSARGAEESLRLAADADTGQRGIRRHRCGGALPTAAGARPPGAWVDIPPYQIDVLVRGSESLAKTKDGQLARAVL